jgi:hypothetical protein
MSTATLLIVTARLRSIAHADGNRCPAPSRTLSGRSRVIRGVDTISLSRRASAGSRPARMLPRACPASPLAGAGAWTSLVPRARAVIVAGLIALVLSPQSAAAQQADDPQVPVLPTLTAEAESEPDGRRIGGSQAQAPCVQVDVAGHRAGHLECATQALTEAARVAQSEARAGIDAPVPRAGSPDAQLGVANQTATRLRMGNALGRSVNPERPASRPPRAGRP